MMEPSGFRKTVRKVVAFSAVAYVFALLLVAAAGAHVAYHNAESVLDSAEDDAITLYRDTYCTMLLNAANNIAENLGTLVPKTAAEMQLLRRQFDLDELNLVDTNGVIVSTSDPAIRVGRSRLDESPLSAPFMDLLHPPYRTLAQDFRPGVDNPLDVRMYAGVPFADYSGLVEVGFGKHHAAADFWLYAPHFTSNWTFDRGGFYLFCERHDRRIRIDSRGATNLLGRAAADCIRTEGDLFSPRAGTFRASIGNRLHICRAYRFDDVMTFACMPVGAHVDIILLPCLAMAVVLLAILALFAGLHLKAERANLHVTELRAAEDARRMADLANAQLIQQSALPMIFPPFPRDLTMSVFARTHAARNVGGDFYDFYYVGADRLAVLVADVSGKGVPAAMFMMQAQTILQGCLLSINDLGEAVAAANARLCAHNESGMFVTCWAGILDERAGTLTYVNAGHNPPYVRHRDGSLEKLGKVSGLFLAGMPDTAYHTFMRALAPGDTLFLYTDGVTEAVDADNRMFDEKRLEEVLARPAASPAALCAAVNDAVTAFAAGQPQFDDITMLALSYRGRPAVFTLSQPCSVDALPVFAAFIEEHLDAAACPLKTKNSLLVALDEILANVVSYSGTPSIEVRLEIARDPGVARVTVIDAGKPWNPLAHADPDITLSAADRKIGGLGILLAKRLMDDVSYSHVNAQNVFRFRKAFAST